MSCCAVNTLGGRPGGGGSPAPPLEERGAVVSVIVAAAAVGSTDNRVLLFTAPTVQLGPIPVATWLTVDNDAVLGSTFTVLQPGVCSLFMNLPVSAGSNVSCFATKNATVSQRQISATPIFFIEPEIYGGRFSIGGPTMDLNHFPTIPVTAADIANGTNVLRVHVFDPTNITGGVPAGAYINPADTGIRIELT